MITHFSELKLQTVSIQGVKQIYSRLCFPIDSESEKRISFQITEHCKITFEEVFEPISPAHIAFEVPYNQIDECVEFVKEAGIILSKWSDGREIYESETSKSVYFRDGDGNLLELNSHSYINNDVIPAVGK